MLTPMDIHNKDFKRAAIRGYKEDEVDEFLDRVVADYEKILKDNERLKEQLSSSEKEVAQFRQLEKSLKDTLVVAQTTAEEVMNAAKKNAEEMRNNTKRECQNIREQAQIDARRQIDDANIKLRNIVNEYDRLVRDKNAFLLKMRTALEAELAVTVQVLNGIPHPDDSNSNVNPVQQQPEPSNIPTEPEPVASAPAQAPVTQKTIVQRSSTPRILK